MAYQQPGPYPGVPQYPGGPGGLPAKPPVPPTVQRAFQLMLAGAALTLVGAIAIVAQQGSIRSSLDKALPSDSPDTINSLVTGAIVLGFVAAAVEIGLWLWMAFAAKAGHNYARIVSSVFFGLDAATVFFGTITFAASSSNGNSSTTFASSETALGQVTGWLTFLVGLGAIVMLWRKESTAYFKPPTPVYGPYGPGYPVMPGGPMQAGAPGQQPGDPWGTPPAG